MLDLDHFSERSHLDSIALKLLHFIPNISGALHARFRTLQDQRSHSSYIVTYSNELLSL